MNTPARRLQPVASAPSPSPSVAGSLASDRALLGSVRRPARALRAFGIGCVLLVALPFAHGCDVADAFEDAGSAQNTKGILPLLAGQAIDFLTGLVVEKGSFKQDLYATDNGSGLKLSPGGPEKITESYAVNWFRTAGGVEQTWSSLDAVPNQKPADPDALNGLPLLHAKAGVGFVLKTHAGYWVKGWIESATWDEVVIHYERMAD